MEWGGDFLFTKTWDFNFHPSGEILFYILDILKKAYIEAKKKKKKKMLPLNRIRTEVKPSLQCIL